MAIQKHASTLESVSRSVRLACIKVYLSSRNQEIQSQMTQRAIELLSLPPDTSMMLLDIGCGSGLSGEILDEDGHVWVGVDISPSMLR